MLRKLTEIGLKLATFLLDKQLKVCKVDIFTIFKGHTKFNGTPGKAIFKNISTFLSD